MKLRTALCVALLGLGTLACGGATVGDDYTYSTALTAPWDGMSLPVNDGSVMTSTADQLTVTYTSGDATQIANDYLSAFEGAGWSVANKIESDGNTVAQLQNGGQTYQFAVSGGGGFVTVAIMKS